MNGHAEAEKCSSPVFFQKKIFFLKELFGEKKNCVYLQPLTRKAAGVAQLARAADL